ncbi:MAG: S-layer homology domain-containing protein [Chloroflexota bacterium]|nr:S-layer homology domain-containing protein [Chloroflexota bacterium]MDQ5865948.1 S-layer homology domain-containing protein [Chloroflexota bacterium]
MRSRIAVDRRKLALAVMLLGLIVTAAFAAQSAQRNSAVQPGTPLTRADVENSLYLAEPGESGQEESIMLGKRDAFMEARYTYPTGKADRQWVLDAAKQDKLVRSGIPAGRVTYKNPSGPNAPEALNASRWISLGPQPQDSNTCEVCYAFGIVAGRVNDIVVDPISQTIAYIASDGGGVWKTTNCCSAATTWAPTMDDPYLSTLAIGDLAIEPDGHTIYAGTGDLRFGSFSFGSAGLLKSTDLGATWQVKGYDVFGPAYEQPASVYPQYNSIGKVAINPHDNNDLAVGTKHGMYFSYDEGETWAGPCLPDPFPNQRQDITGILAMTQTNTLTDLFVAVGARGYSTTVQYNLAENGANSIYKTTWPSSGCPTSWSHVSRADNGWPPGSGTGIPQYKVGGNQLGRIDLAYAESNPNYIYAEVQAINPGFGAIQRGGMLGIWRSTDRGQTWQQRTTAQDLEDAEAECGGTCVEDSLLNVCGDVAQNWYDQHIVVDPNNPEVIFFDNINVWRSNDGGATVKDLTCGYAYIQTPRPPGYSVHVDQHAITFLPGSSSRQLIGNDGGVYYTENANSDQPLYLQLNNSLSTIEFYGGDISANFATSNNPFAVAGAQDNGSSSWTGSFASGDAVPKLWQQRIGGDGMFARIEPVFGQRVYMEAQNGAMRRSDGGHTGPYVLNCLDISNVPNAPGCIPTNFNLDAPFRSFIFPYEIYKGVPAAKGPGDECDLTPGEGCKHFIGGTNRVWENLTGLRDGSTASGRWYPTSPVLTKGTLSDRSFINQLAFAFRTDKIAIAGTNDGNVWIGFGLGAGQGITSTWKNLTGGNAVLPNRPILDVVLSAEVISVTTTPVGYAAVGGFNENTPNQPGHVFQVTCGANCNSFSWLDKSGNLPNIPVNAITLNPNFPQQVFAGTDWGVYYTNNINAVTPVWYRFNQGMPNIMIWDFAIDRGFTTLAAFTRSRGAFVWPLTSGPFEQTATPTVTGTPPNTATASATAETRTPQIPATYTPFVPTTPTPLASPTMLACGSERLLYETFESGTLGVFQAEMALGNPARKWTVTQQASHTGLYSAYVQNNDVDSDQRLVISPTNVMIPASASSAQLQFYHRYKFEVISEPASFDGGVLEYSTDNGVNWSETLTMTTEGGYDSTITGPDNPLNGRPGWGGTNADWPDFQRVTVDLTTLKGKSVKLRWRHGSDDSGDAEGWYVDNVVITYTGTCPFTATPTQTRTATRTATVTATATQTAIGGASSTATQIGIATATLTQSAVATGTATGTSTALVIATGTSTTTTQATSTGTSIATSTTTGTATRTSTAVASATATLTRTASASATRTSTAVATGTRTATAASATPTACLTTFQDLPPTNDESSFYPFVRCLACRGIVTGYPCGGTNPQTGDGEPCGATGNPYFRPGNYVTRGQISKMVSEASRNNDDAGNQLYEDVAPGSPFYVWINRLSNQGVMGGYPCGGPGEPCGEENRPYFRPSANATRGQLSKIVSNTAGYNEQPTGQTFADVPPSNNPSSFYPYIQRLSSRGVMGGYPCGGPDEPCGEQNRPYFRPNNLVTRGQAAKIVANTFYPNCQTPARR